MVAKVFRKHISSIDLVPFDPTLSRFLLQRSMPRSITKFGIVVLSKSKTYGENSMHYITTADSFNLGSANCIGLLTLVFLLP